MSVEKSDNLITILIPAYNIERYISKCLRSVLAQTYKNLQIVIVDDGSSDNTLTIARQFAYKDKRIEVHHQDNGGVAKARNTLLSFIKGEFFIFIDGDDWLEPDMIEYLYTNIENHNAEISTCELILDNNKPNVVSRLEIFDRKHCVKQFLYHTSFRGSLWNKLFRTSAFDSNLLFEEGIGYGEDALFCWNFLKNTKRIVFSTKELYHYRMRPGSITHSEFGKKKFSGHEVWRIISDEVKELYPELEYIAKGRHGLEDMYLLRDASQRGYKMDENIRILQKVVKDNFKDIHKMGVSETKELIYTYLIARWYGFGKIYKFMHNMKMNG